MPRSGMCSKGLHDLSVRGVLRDGECKACAYKRSRDWRRSDKGVKFDRVRHLANTYGITTEQYDEMFSRQKGRCCICGRHQSELKRTFHIDHCHETGRIRGLLCIGCNTRLGWFERYFDEAVSYLESH